MSDKPKFFAQKVTKSIANVITAKKSSRTAETKFDIIEHLILPVLGVVFILDFLFASYSLLIK